MVISFYTAYVAGDVEAALSHLCEKDARSQGAAREFIARSQATSSPFRIERFDVKKAEPLWSGDAPYFYVPVEFPRGERDAISHAHRVRARDGCIERFLGGPAAPPGASQQAPAPAPAPSPSPAPGDSASVPAPPPLEAPIDADDEVVEL